MRFSDAAAVQQKTANDKLVYVYAASSILYSGIFSMAMLLMGYISDNFGASVVFIISGMLLILVSMIGCMNRKSFNG